MVLPPPAATATSAPVSLITSATRSTSCALGTPPNPVRFTGRSAAFSEASMSWPTRPHTRSSATINGVEPICFRYSPSSRLAPFPWTYRPGLITVRTADAIVGPPPETSVQATLDSAVATFGILWRLNLRHDRTGRSSPSGRSGRPRHLRESGHVPLAGLHRRPDP